ncbi:hypothetical protein FHG87_013818 [Trinorchestia longiramus]|nr:hypothetical protein FHG87_013818 [Trinorchestia longiramus]
MLDYMEGRDLHLRQTVLEEKKPRVPLYSPLDSQDVMVVPENALYSSLSSAPSFTDRMIGDRNLLHHHREGRLARCGTPHSLYTDNMNPSHTIADLRDTIMALQLQNNELTMCLQQERRRREEAENKVEREKGYIKRLEDTIQALKSTRLVIDPSMYRQIAESYIASRQTPVRRTCSSGLQRAGRYEDLVCDSSPEGSLPSSPPNSSASQLLRNPNSSTDGHMELTSDRLGNAPPPSSSSLSGSSGLQSQLNSPHESHDLRWPSDRGDSRPPVEDVLFRDDRPPASTSFSCSSTVTDVQRL